MGVRPRGPAERQAREDSLNRRVGDVLQLVCGYDACPKPGGQFTRVAKRGPEPAYCSDACRQGAYRLRTTGLRTGERRSSTAPRRAGHRIQLTLPLDVFKALSTMAWEGCEGTATVAARLLSDAVRAGTAADEASVGLSDRERFLRDRP